MATKTQLAKIHIAKKELGLSDEDYSDILSAYDVQSAKDLSFADAEHLLRKLEEIGWKPKKARKEKKYSDLSGRAKYYATPKQLRMIEGLWLEVSRAKTPDSLRNFIERITGKSDITFLEKEDASKIINALIKMKKAEK